MQSKRALQWLATSKASLRLQENGWNSVAASSLIDAPLISLEPHERGQPIPLITCTLQLNGRFYKPDPRSAQCRRSGQRSTDSKGCEMTATVALFLATVLFWGSGAIVTSLQASASAPELSVAIRMFLVGLSMLGFSIATGKPITIARSDRLWVMMQGILFFGLAFIAFYKATKGIPSGIAALVLSSSSLFAAIASRLLLNLRISHRATIGIVCGLLGLGIVAAPQIFALRLNPQTVTGFIWAGVAAMATGAGTAIAARNQRRGLPIPVLMGWGALCGCGFGVAWAMVVGTSLTIPVTVGYLAQLAYLAIVASCVTFLMYFTLIEKVGPARAAYALTVVPIVAITISIIFEGLHIDTRLAFGGATILLGNILVLNA
ncbi:DMT family transporter [Rhizobium tropici]|nr:DMT family transporter [Rhizobium tropici]